MEPNLTLKALYSFIYLLPVWGLVWIVEYVEDYESEAMRMGFSNYFFIVCSSITLIFIITRYLANLLINKIKKSKGADFVTSQSAMIGVSIIYLTFITSFIAIVISGDYSSYAKWARGIKELEIYTKIEMKKTKRETEYIEEALRESKAKDESAYNLTLNLYNKHKKYKDK